MAIKGVYTALSGAIAQSTKLDTIANNIANVNTPGFKRDQQVFSEYLTANEKEPTTIPIPKDVAAIESFYNMQGGDKSYVHEKGTYTDFSQGSLKRTGGALDLAIEGPGFFELSSPNGVRYTRAGNFTVDGNGRLVTKEGYPVLRVAEEGTPESERVFQFTAEGSISISENGQVSQGENLLGQISLVNVANPDAMMKIGNNLYGPRPTVDLQINQIPSPALKQGFLETSNVNVVSEMTDMITTHRIFESTQKAISAYDSMVDKAVNVVGKTTP
ncbi:MAG: flagellar basal-body rod protein FlgF [Bdellovibrionales bacterium]